MTEERIALVRDDAPLGKDERPGSPKEELRDLEGKHDPSKLEQVQSVKAQAGEPILTGRSSTDEEGSSLSKEHSVHSELVSSTRP